MLNYSTIFNWWVELTCISRGSKRSLRLANIIVTIAMLCLPAHYWLCERKCHGFYKPRIADTCIRWVELGMPKGANRVWLSHKILKKFGEVIGMKEFIGCPWGRGAMVKWRDHPCLETIGFIIHPNKIDFLRSSEEFKSSTSAAASKSRRDF